MSIHTSWRLLVAECLLTVGMGHTLIPLLCLSIGLTQGEIGIREVICSITYLVFNIPTGWLADRLSRKACNFIGDILYGISLVILALSTSFTEVTVAGVIMAFGNACTQGADEALFKAHCDELGKDYQDTRRRVLQTATWAGLIHHLMGGWILISLFGLRATLLVASVSFFIAAVISCFIKEISTHKKEVAGPKSNSLKAKLIAEAKGMARVIRYSMIENRKLAWLLIAYAVGATMGGPIMVFIGPMILAVGRSNNDIGFAYVIVIVAALCGGWLSRHTPKKWSTSTLFWVSSSVSIVIMAITSIGLTLTTVVLHIAIVHTVRCWISRTVHPLIHSNAPDDIQATVGSLMSSVSQVLYMGVVIVINFAGNYGVRWGIAANAILFAPLIVLVAWKLYRQEKNSAKM